MPDSRATLEAQRSAILAEIVQLGDSRSGSISVISGRCGKASCRCCRNGFAPRDQELDVEATQYSPGVRRMTALVGSETSFERGRVLLVGHDLRPWRKKNVVRGGAQ